MAESSRTLFKPIPGKGAIVAYTGTASTAAVAPANAIAVDLYCTTAAHVCIDKNKSAATVTDLPVLANVPVTLRCEPGDNLSAIQQASGGNLCYSFLC